MKVLNFLCVVVILTLYYCAPPCEGLICYTCTKDKQRCLEGDYLAHEDCDAVFDKKFVPENRTACVKIVERHTANNTFHIERGCRTALANITQPKNVNLTIDFCTDYLRHHPESECSQCEDYFCNGGHKPGFVINKWMSLIFIPAIMWFLWMKKQN